MALVKKMEYRQKDGSHPHYERDCTYSLFVVGGEKFLQIDTYTSKEKKRKGDQSQTLRFGSKGIKELRQALREYDATNPR